MTICLRRSAFLAFSIVLAASGALRAQSDQNACSMDRMELDPVTALEPSPGLRAARASDVDREAAGRQAVDEADDVARHAAVERLCRQE